MSTDTLAWWSEHLTEYNAQLMLIGAAKAHTKQFSNPEEIGMGWAKELRSRGYNALCPYARNYIAHEYLRFHETVGA